MCSSDLNQIQRIAARGEQRLNTLITLRGRGRALRLLTAGVLGAGLLGAQVQAHAATAAVYGSIGNFDVINHTGHPAHGFEIDIEGVNTPDMPYTYSYQRYGQSSVTQSATGVKVRWAAQYLGNGFSATTAPYTGGEIGRAHV